MEEIKPCPFCKGKARTTNVISFDGEITWWVIGCDNGPYGSICPGNLDKAAPLYVSRQQAIDFWNRRAD